jgi:16S rRNA (guanine527-N7)-methyltransferase
MQPARIAELLQPYLSPLQNPCHSEPGQRPGEEPAVPAVLSAAQLQSISTYIDLLLHWNARINLTAIRNEEEIVTRHFGESLFAASHLFSPNAVVKGFDVADLGSGAGFPGIPIKLWAPHIALTLIESNHKKATFLREVVRALTLTDVNIQNVRAETLPPSTFNVVTVRAVERFDQVLPIAANLLVPSARLALLLGPTQALQCPIILPGFRWHPTVPLPESQASVLLIGEAPAPRK